MRIPDEHRKMLVDEIAIVRTLMAKTDDLEKKLYYFSAIYGIMDRLNKTHFDRQLTFMQMIYEVTYGTIRGRVEVIKGGETVVPIEADFDKRLDEILNHLQKTIKSKKDDGIYKNLENLVCLSYSTTGPGRYIYEKGLPLLKE